MIKPRTRGLALRTGQGWMWVWIIVAMHAGICVHVGFDEVIPAESLMSCSRDVPVKLRMAVSGPLAEKPLTVMTAMIQSASKYADHTALGLFILFMCSKWASVHFGWSVKILACWRLVMPHSHGLFSTQRIERCARSAHGDFIARA